MPSFDKPSYLTAVFFSGAACAFGSNSEGAGICGLGRLRRGGRGLVFGELGDLACGDAEAEGLEDFVAAHDFVFKDDNNVVDFNVARRFDRLAVDGDAAKAASVGGKGAGLEDAHGPEPLIQSNGWSRIFRHRNSRGMI